MKYFVVFVINSVNELLKIKDDLTKERDEKLSEISKVQENLNILYFLYVHTFERTLYNALNVGVARTWFMDLTVTTCHIQYTFLSLCNLSDGELVASILHSSFQKKYMQLSISQTL